MNKLLFILSIGFFQLGISQTTITYAANDPVIGNTVNNVNVNGTVDNTATGNGVTFSNTALTMGTAAPTTFSAPTSTEIASYPGSTIKSVDGTGISTFYKSSSAKLEVTAIVNPTVILKFSTNNATAMVYPTSFGTNDVDNASGTFTYTTYNGTFSGTITNSGDATGTLLIGSKTYPNILRVKSVQNFNLFYEIFPGVPSQVGTAVSTSYSYYDNLSRYPLLATVNGNINVPALSINQNNNSAIAQQTVFLNSAEVDLKKALFIFPNPVQDILHISGNLSGLNEAIIYTMDGKLLKEIKLTSELNISDLKTGQYLLVLKGKDREQASLKIIKK